MTDLSVIVPCYNEDEVIGRFHTTLVAELERLGVEFEVCYIDDGSRDTTRLQLREFSRADERIRYLSFSRNFGKEAAILAGLRTVAGEAVVLMDADLQHPPSLLEEMLRLQAHGYDQVVAQRDRAGDGRVRTLFSKAYYRLMRRCTDVDLVDGQGDFRMLSRKAVDAVIALPESNRFSKGIFSWIGFETVALTYTNVERAAGSSKWGGSKLLNYGIDGLLSFNSRPLRLVIHLGMWLLLSAVAYALWILAGSVFHGIDTPGYTTLIAAITGLAGIQLATLGIIGEYVGRIYGESKHRPHYVVCESSESSQPAAALTPHAHRAEGPFPQ